MTVGDLGAGPGLVRTRHEAGYAMSLATGYLVGAEPATATATVPVPVPVADAWPDWADRYDETEAVDHHPGPGAGSGPDPVPLGAVSGWLFPETSVGWTAAGRPVPRLVASPSPAPRDRAGRARATPPQEPTEPILARLLEGTLATAAGRFFEPDLAAATRLPVAPPGMFTVHLGTGPAGFQVNGRPVPPALLARLIRACPEWRGRPLLVLAHPQPAPNRLAALARALLTGVGVPVYTADAGVLLLPGGAITGTSFRRWSVPADGRNEAEASTAVGPWLPHEGLATARAGERAAPVRTAEPAEPRPLPVPAIAPVPLPAALATPAAGQPSAPGPIPPVVRRALPTATPWSPPVPASPSPPPASPPPASPPPGSGLQGPSAPVERSPAQAPSQGTDPGADVGGGARPGSRRHRRTPPADTRTRPAAAPVRSAVESAVEEAPGHGRDLAAAPHHVPGNAPPLPDPTEATATDSSADGTHEAARVPRQVAGDGSFEGAHAKGDRFGSDRFGSGRFEGGRSGWDAAGGGFGADRADTGHLLPWLAVLPRVTVEDRDRLRTLLGWRYETHARAVMGALALQPGLRAGAGADDLLAGLVAVRAYLSAAGRLDSAGRSVNAALRSAERRPDDDGLILLARCVQAGLGRLPAVVGPVFRPAAASPDVLSRHRPGDMLVEPAFLEVSTAPWELPGRTVEYVIWSSTARRTTWLGADATPGGSSCEALFVAGTRFVVLAVDRATEDEDGRAGAGEAPTRVLLREVVGGRVDAALAQRALGRLRDVLADRPPAASGAGAPGGPDGALPERLRFALGVGAGGRAFAPDGARLADALGPAATT
ncbi:hypothetical protein [Frankia sp. AvcI1]|uniref:hypothetical protein n=1 Tax=Frankia sp. AvcI1 TaxID=573496 RepID=UPI0006EC22B6|nr:hypothetical protein [Frankia sp. AvcI1]